jgi:hypothetical protein
LRRPAAAVARLLRNLCRPVVFNGDMKSSVKAVAAAAVGLFGALTPAVASAKVVELGTTRTPLVAPKCPPGVASNNCFIILTRVTALETIRDGVAYPTTVKQAGKIVAFTLGLSRLDPSRSKTKTFIHDLDTVYGGVPQAAITVLRRVGSSRQRRFTVTGESSMVHLIPYLGQVTQFPTDRPLSVQPGDVVALTTPTWAPVLTYQLSTSQFAYRQSRTTGCGSAATTNDAQLLLRSTATYGCNYPGTRVEYSATEVTDAVPTKNFVHAPDVGSIASVVRDHLLGAQ